MPSILGAFSTASPLAIGALGGAILVFALIDLGLRTWVPRAPRASTSPPGPLRTLGMFVNHPTFVLCSACAQVALGISCLTFAIVQAAH